MELPSGGTGVETLPQPASESPAATRKSHRNNDALFISFTFCLSICVSMFIYYYSIGNKAKNIIQLSIGK